jgi:hypothetical protein
MAMPITLADPPVKMSLYVVEAYDDPKMMQAMQKREGNTCPSICA